MNNLIYQYNVNPTTVNSVNVGKANIKGYELALEQKFDNWLHLFANYTHNDATLVRDAVNPAAVGCQLAQVPAEMFNAGGDFTYKSFSGSLIGSYVGKRYGQDVNSDRTNGVFGSYDPYLHRRRKALVPGGLVRVGLSGGEQHFRQELLRLLSGTGKAMVRNRYAKILRGAAAALLAALSLLPGGRAAASPGSVGYRDNLGKEVSSPFR